MECFVEYGEFGIEGIVVLFVVGWLDVGMWDVIWEIMLKDDDGNVVCGLIVFEDMQDSFVCLEGCFIVCVGMKDVVVIEMVDVVLVVNKYDVQCVKNIVVCLKIDQ